MNERTEWFPHHIKPVRVGVYEVQNMYDRELPALFNHWDGERWTGSATDIDKVIVPASKYNLAFQDRVWRGLTKESA
jgi:hypothetical protein